MVWGIVAVRLEVPLYSLDQRPPEQQQQALLGAGDLHVMCMAPSLAVLHIILSAGFCHAAVATTCGQRGCYQLLPAGG